MAITTAYFDAAAHMQTELIVFGILAALGAFAIGCIGLGGVIWLPAFIALFPEHVIPASIGVATLFAAALPMSCCKFAVWAYYGRIPWKSSIPLASLAAPGALLGAAVVKQMPKIALAIVVSSICMLAGVEQALKIRRKRQAAARRRAAGHEGDDGAAAAAAAAAVDADADTAAADDEHSSDHLLLENGTASATAAAPKAEIELTDVTLAVRPGRYAQGDRVEVWWADEDAWFPGVIAAVRGGDGGGVDGNSPQAVPCVSIAYEDGETEDDVDPSLLRRRRDVVAAEAPPNGPAAVADAKPATGTGTGEASDDADAPGGHCTVMSPRREMILTALGGAVVAFGSSISGTGGPIILFPVVFWLRPKIDMHRLIGLSSPFGFLTVLAAAVGGFAFNTVDMAIAGLFAGIMCLFVVLGSVCAQRIRSDNLKFATAVAIVCTGIFTIIKASIDDR